MHARSSPVLALVAVAALVLSSGPAFGADRDIAIHEVDPSQADARSRKLALGISMPDGRDLSKLDDLRASIGGQPVATWTIWRQWGRPALSPVPMAAAEGARQRGAVPIIWWEPISPSDWSDTTYTRHQNIIDGLHDDYIRRFALDAREYGHRVLLRFAHQANSDYLPWAWDYSTTDDNTRQTFKRAWRHVVRIFRDVGASNVKFVWSVATQTCAGDCLKRPLSYPGASGSTTWASPGRTGVRPRRTPSRLRSPGFPCSRGSGRS